MITLEFWVEIHYDRGIIVVADQQKLYLDPEISSLPIGNTTLVTHAHSDHTSAISGSAKTYLTETTLKLYEKTSSRYPKNYSYVNFEETFEIGPFEIEFLPAGHLLGASQIIIREGNRSFLYTGDFCPEKLLTVEGAKFTKEDFDIVMMDATYGDDLIQFGDREQTRQSLFIWAITQINNGSIPIINVGHLGGAQELIKLFNNLAANLPIIVDEKIDKVSEIFNKHGMDLKYHTFNDPNLESLLDEKCLILMPRSFKKIEDLQLKHHKILTKVVRAIVTGQTAKYGFTNFQYASALSTHAHYHELINTVKTLQPQHILTHYGYANKFADALVKKYSMSAECFQSSKPIDFNNINTNFVNAKTNSQKDTLKYKTLDQYFS